MPVKNFRRNSKLKRLKKIKNKNVIHHRAIIFSQNKEKK